MLRKELKMQNFIYNQPEAKCDFCKATENPHPDYDETIPITRIDIGKKRKLTLCINCFFMHKERSEKKGHPLIAYLSKLNNLSLILNKSNKKKPGKADTLNYLGFTTRKLGDFENGEKYYLQGLAIDPKHIGINEYLGELYVATNRHNLAVERLGVLEGCNCEEYDQLKAVISGEKSKY